MITKTPASVSLQAAAEELLRRRQAQSDLVAFCEYTFPGYVKSNCCNLIADALMKVYRGEIKRLILNAPPRHSKSEHVSRRFPAFWLGNFPQSQIINTAYSDDKANGNSLAVREIIKDARYQRLWPRTFTSENVQRWQFSEKENKNPNFLSAGVGGGITGEGADLLIIDDPIKNSEEAESQHVRDKHWEWYTTTARTRLQPNASVILTMARWHKDDLAGRLLDLAQKDPTSDQWTVVNLPAIQDWEKKTVLWPQFYSFDDLMKVRGSIGPKSFASLYQGDPVIAEGNIFKRDTLRYYKELPKLESKVVYWDTAFKTSQRSDFSAYVEIGIANEAFYVLDCWNKRAEYPELKRMVSAQYYRDLPNVVLVENKMSGIAIVQELQRDTRIPIMSPSSQRVGKFEMDKVARANAVSGLVETGKVLLPESAPWLYDFIEQLCAFPSAPHDDMVDAFTGCLEYCKNFMVNQGPIVQLFGR